MIELNFLYLVEMAGVEPAAVRTTLHSSAPRF